MTDQRYEYELHVWRKKPENFSALPLEYWRAHVTGAYKIPSIGEAIESAGFLDDYNLFRVFEVKHRIGGGLSALVTDGRSKLKEVSTPTEMKGLVLVLAYSE